MTNKRKREDDEKQCVLAPINIGKTRLSVLTDYLREKVHFNVDTKYTPKWVDSKYNTAKVGDKFAFVHQKDDTMEIFDVIGLVSSTSRKYFWTLPEYQERNVLILSNIVDTIKFTDYKRIHGYGEKWMLHEAQRCDWKY